MFVRKIGRGGREQGYTIFGAFEDGELIIGVTLLPGGHRYKGEFEDLVPHGQGTLKYANGDSYVGEIR